MNDKPLLVLLPGLLCDGAAWTEVRGALAARADAFVAEYGMAASLTAMAETVLAAVDRPRFALAGHSMGGRVALEMLRLAPERIARVALLDTGCAPLAAGDAGERERAGRLALLEIARRDGMRAMAREWAFGMVHPSRRDGPVFDAVLDMFERRTPELFAAQIRALLERPDATPQLAAIRCPALVLTGRQDDWAPPSQHEAMARAIAGAQLAIVEDCGHMSPMEQPAAVSDLFAHWLARAA
jgi:pimeloyl-ACP methyl ester carboxylesterase